MPEVRVLLRRETPTLDQNPDSGESDSTPLFSTKYMSAKYYCHIYGRPQDFFQGWASRGSEGWRSRSGAKGRASVGVTGAKPPEADDIFSKECINISSIGTLDNICSRKKTLYNISG